ncbi:MAG: cytidine deaminase [Ruminococcus sp.]|nr:cytidine deaminase [Ruminococcus sp.]
MTVEETLFTTAVEFIKTRYPTGWGGAAVIRTEDGKMLISVAPEVNNASAELCIETGAICEAHKLNVKVTHCICVVRDNEKSKFKILTPCGICQERLRYWGGDVLVGVTDLGESLKFVPLKELMPYWWHNAYANKA